MRLPSAYPVQNDLASGQQVPVQTTVVELFAYQVLAHPFSIALEVSDKSFTYQFLWDEADRLARFLAGHAIGRDDVVAICLKRTENLLIAMLGVLKAGAAYLPLSPSDPTLRLGQVIAHAGARCIVTDATSEANLPQQAAPVFRFEDPLPDGDNHGGKDLERLPSAADLAYVIYTSGTTGTPKGVAVTHGALANVTVDVAERVAFAESDSWLAVTTVCFDIAVLELLLPLCYGGKVILASEDQSRIGRVLVGILRNKKPSVMQATPITWKILIESGWAGSPGMTLLCGGDRLDRDLANQLLDRSVAVWNMYGPTETTVWSTADRLRPGNDPVTIGRPILNTQVFIVDDHAELQPIGAVGEICIGGAGVARGYVGDPDLTRKRFIDLRFSEAPAMRVYRTGDLGRWNEGGQIEFLGRIDQQVKINGYRIELQEIEQVMRSYPGVLDVAVVGVSGPSSQKRLYAFVVSEADAPMTTAALVAHLERHLPQYMLPEKFWALSRIPATRNGKRDAAALEAYAKVTLQIPDSLAANGSESH